LLTPQNISFMLYRFKINIIIVLLNLKVKVIFTEISGKNNQDIEKLIKREY